MRPEQRDAWQSAEEVVRWALCPFTLPVGLYLASELTGVILFKFGGRSSAEPFANTLAVLMSPIFGASAATLSVVLAMLVVPCRHVQAAWVMFLIGASIAAFLFLGALKLVGISIVLVALPTFAAGAAAGVWLPRYLAAWQARQVGTQHGSTPPELPRWAEWAASIATAVVASGMIYAVCLLFVFNSMWFYPRGDLAFLRHGHPEAVTGALTAAAWVACGSLAAPTRRAWVPMVLLCAAIVPVALILGVTGPFSNWGPPVLEFAAGTSIAGFLTAVVLAVLLVRRNAGR